MSKGLYRSEEANLGNIASMAHLRDEKGHLISDDDFYKNIREQGIEKGDLAQAHSKKMRETYGDTLDKNYNTEDLKRRREELEEQNKKLDNEIKSISSQELMKDNEESQERLKNLQAQKAKNENEIQSLDKLIENPMTFAQVAANMAESQVQSQYGQAKGINKNLDKNAAMYAENAQYGEMSRQQTTNERINQLGGIDKAVALDNTMASIKAESDRAGAKAQVEEALRADGMDDKLAKKFAEEIINGSREGAKEFERALNKIGEKAETLTRAKEGSEYKKIGEYDSPDDYVKAQELASQQQEDRGAKKLFETSNNPEIRQKLLDQEIKMAKDMNKFNEYRDAALKLGFAKEENGKLVAADTEDWIRGRALAANSSIDRMFVGGMRMDHQYNALGDGLVNADASINGKKGSNFTANLGKPNNITQAESQEMAELMMNPKKLSQTFIGKTYDWIKKHLEQLGFSEGASSVIAASVTAGGATVATATSIEGVQTLFNAAVGKRVATKDFSYIDAKGEKQYIHKGKEFKLSDIPENYRGIAKDSSKVEEGLVRKFIKNNFKKNYNEVNPSKISMNTPHSINETKNTTSNSSNTTQNQHSDSSHENKSQHNQTPSNQSTSSINDGNQNVKSPAREKFEDIIQNKEKELSKNYAAGKINDDEFKKQSVALEGIKHKLENGQPINYGDLKNAGIKVSDLQKDGFIFKTNDKGNITGIDFGKSNEILGNAQNKFDLNKMLKDFAYQEAVNDHIDKVKENLIKNNSPDDEFIKQIDSIQDKINKGELKVSDLIENAKTLSERHT